MWVMFIGNSCKGISEFKILFNGNATGWLQWGAVQEQNVILFIHINQEERLANTRRAHQQSGDVRGAAVGSRVRYCCRECARATPEDERYDSNYP